MAIARHDSYRSFAAHYDLYGLDWFATMYGERLLRLLEERGQRTGRVLDAGCGTGSLALLLAGRGYGVVGIDLSEAMIEIARRKDANGSVTWRVADITAFDVLDTGGPFDLVTCVADTLNHLETLDEWEAAFRCFAAHLRPGGRLLLDAMTCRGLERLDKFGVSELDDKTLLVSIIYEPAARRSTLKAISFVPAATAGLYEKAVEAITEWGQPVAGIFERLARAGFGPPERLWSRSEDPEDEDRLMVLAERRHEG